MHRSGDRRKGEGSEDQRRDWPGVGRVWLCGHCRPRHNATCWRKKADPEHETGRQQSVQEELLPHQPSTDTVAENVSRARAGMCGSLEMVGNSVVLGCHGFCTEPYCFCDLEGGGVLGRFLVAAPGPSRAGAGAPAPAALCLRKARGRGQFAEPPAGSQPAQAQGFSAAILSCFHSISCLLFSWI